MSELKIIKASAGSGKTYRLTLEYLHLLFSGNTRFHQILAVTFTNKATGEMKNRIINELSKIASGNSPDIVNEIKKTHKLSDYEIKEKASQYLAQILHKYSSFSVSTIDSFFQNIIKAFAREAGLPVNYEMELNNQEVIEKATEQLLLKIDQKPELQQWLTRFADERITEGKNWVFRNDIQELAQELFREEFQLMGREFIQEIGNHQYLNQLQHKLLEIRNSFEKQLKEFGIQSIQVLESLQLYVDDFSFGKTGPAGFLTKLTHEVPKEIGKRINGVLEKPSAWVPGKAKNKALLEQIANDKLHPLLVNATTFYLENIKMYLSANEVLSRFYALGLMADLSAEISEYIRDNNIFILAESGRLLKALIDNNDAPFIYERSGRTYKHFMIDEFQDTSKIQWANFMPLIKNSLSENHENLIVGDLKQSIYRWRNSDWKIMARQISSDLHDYRINHEFLEYNWRSAENIVKFNNSLFSTAANVFQNKLLDNLTDVPDFENKDFLKQIITEIYQTAVQQVPAPKTGSGGYTRLSFVNIAENTDNTDDIENQENTDDTDNDNNSNKILEEVQKTIETLQDKQHSLKDIAILVRGKNEGKKVADYLNMLNARRSETCPYRYNVISNESVFVYRAPSVQLIIAIIGLLNKPNDGINKTIAEHRLRELNPMLLPLPDLNLLLPGWQSLNISGLVNEIIYQFGLNNLTDQLPYLQSFTDAVFEYGSANPANLNLFIEWWDKKGITKTVCLTESQDAIRILTIHKSKGMEYKNVIIPYCNWNVEHIGTNSPLLWSQTDVEPFNLLRFVPVKYKKELSKTIFCADYYTEKAHAYIDALNLLYVAFTRAKQNLFVFCPYKDKFNTNGIDLLLRNCFEVSTVLNAHSIDLQQFWNAENTTFEMGEIKADTDLKPHEATLTLQSLPTTPLKARLRQKYLTSIIEPDGSYKPFQTPAEEGIIMHRLFQHIKTVSDIDFAIQLLINEGLLNASQASLIETKVRTYLNEEPYVNWFSNEWEIKTEADIIIPKGLTSRPDRVLIKNKKVLVIDFKFGQQPNTRYQLQINQYKKHLEQMGYTPVEGYIWYVTLNLLEKI